MKQQRSVDGKSQICDQGELNMSGIVGEPSRLGEFQEALIPNFFGKGDRITTPFSARISSRSTIELEK